MTKRISILGSTGSIGESTLDLVRRAKPGEIKIISLTANTNASKLAAQAIEFNSEYVALADASHALELETALAGRDLEIGIGADALLEAARKPADFTMSAIVGAAGLPPTLAAVDQGCHIGLANKECLVCAGDLFMQHVTTHGATLLPVDSEHNAIFQVLETKQPSAVRRLILTASGGPFHDANRNLETVTKTDALAHPVWDMGNKISIDSASLMNKGLELIEASYLFNRPSSEIDIIIHPQSIIHSMVEYVDGSILAQLGSPDMRTPIAYALAWPERMAVPVERLDFAKVANLSFFAPDPKRFAALRLARAALETGGKAPNILNASNEIAVEAFLSDKIRFVDIPKIVEETLEDMSRTTVLSKASLTISDVLAVDNQARRTAIKHIQGL